jgi:gas vesicle protein
MVMKEEYTHRKRSILKPVLAGSAVGAGIALLLAPKSGKGLRKDLERFTARTGKQAAEVIHEGRDLYEEGRKAVTKAVEEGRDLYKEGRKSVMKAVEEGRDLYEEGRKSVMKAVETGREKYDEGRERLSELVYKKKKRSLMVPIMVSGIVGAGIAFLLAPKTGKAVRKDVKRIAVDTRDKVATLIDKGKVLATEAIPEAMEAVSKAFREEKKKIWHAA